MWFFFMGAESGSVLVFVEIELLAGFGFCKSLKVGILYRTDETVSRPGPCNFKGDPFEGFSLTKTNQLLGIPSMDAFSS